MPDKLFSSDTIIFSYILVIISIYAIIIHHFVMYVKS